MQPRKFKFCTKMQPRTSDFCTKMQPCTSDFCTSYTVILHEKAGSRSFEPSKTRFNFSVFRGVALLRFPIFTKTLEIYLYISARV